MAAYEIRMMGSLQVEVGGRRFGARDLGGRKPKQLLEVLLLHRGRPVSKDRLATILWGDSLPCDSVGSLEHYVSVVRRTLHGAGARGDSPIVTEHGGYRVDADRVRVDLFEFDRLDADPGTRRSRARMAEALAMLQGDLLEDEPYAEWVDEARAHVRQRRVRMLIDAAEAAMREADAAESLSLARSAVAHDPLSEPGHRAVIRAHYLAGDQVAALAAFRECRDVLDRELGVAPMPETEQVHQAVLRQVPRAQLLGTALPAAEPDPGGSPQVDRALLRRLRRRGAEFVRVALASAVVPPPCGPEIVAAILRADPLEVAEIQESLCEMRILEIVDDSFCFRCAQTRAALAAQVSPARRRLIAAMTPAVCGVAG